MSDETRITKERSRNSLSDGVTRFVSPDGTVLTDLPPWAKRAAEVRALYRAMLLTRHFDAKAVALQRTGRLGTFASSLGQEAVGVGTASAMQASDILVPSFREQGAQFWRGVTPLESLLYWGGDERGSDFSGPKEDFPVCIPVGTQFPHAAGVGLAFKLRSEMRVCVSVGGDGSTSKGDFYEALNIAGVWQLPVVFVINNNGWAISVPRRCQTHAATLAQKGVAAGVPGEQVDGNDVIAVRDAVSRAIARARDGEGATIVEALTYRLSDHTTADDARRYRSDEEVSARWREEPISRLKQLLVARGDWSKDDEEALLREIAAEVDAAAAAYLAIGPEPVTAMFDHLFAELPDTLQPQLAAALAAAEADDG